MRNINIFIILNNVLVAQEIAIRFTQSMNSE